MIRTHLFPALSLTLGLLVSCTESIAIPDDADLGGGRFASSAHLAIDDTSLYWCDSGRGFVMRAPRGGGESVEFVEMPSRVHSRIAVNETSVFWFDRRLDGGAIDFALMRTSLADGATSFMAMGGRTGNVAVDDRSAFIVARESRSSDAPFFVRRIDLGSGDIRDISDGRGVSTIVVDGEDLVGTNCGDGASDGVWRLSRDGDVRTAIGATTGCAYSAVIDGDWLYYKEAVDVVHAVLYRVPLAGGVPQELARTDSYESIAVYSGFAYALIGGAMTQVDVGDGATRALAPAAGVVGIAVDDDFVYWIEGPEQQPELGPYELRSVALP